MYSAKTDENDANSYFRLRKYVNWLFWTLFVAAYMAYT